MLLRDWLAGERGRATSLAKTLSIATAYVWQMANGLRPTQPQHCRAIEIHTQLAVRVWDLRPDDWHRIWPDLVDAAGAPSLQREIAEARDAA